MTITPQIIKVLVVDDHALFRSGIKAAIEQQPHIKVVGEASDGVEALEKVRRLTPDVILMDLHMPGMGGLEAIKKLQEEHPQVRVLVLTVSEKEADLFTAIKVGAQGYLLKDVETQELLQAVSLVAQGEAIFSPIMASKLLEEFREKETPSIPNFNYIPLSLRQREVVQLVAQGMSNKEIAAALVVSENTIKTHLKNILEKLHLHSRAQAAAYAAQVGLTEKKEKAG